jgi:uncharacterized membrane protein YedE/YeeE
MDSPLPKAFFLGAALAYVLSSCGFSDYTEMNHMLTLADPRLFLIFGGAVVLSALLVKLDKSLCPIGQRQLRWGTVLGSLLFGVGWAISGACPAVPWVQLGEGKLFSLAALLGTLAGMKLYHVVSAKFGWEQGSC